MLGSSRRRFARLAAVAVALAVVAIGLAIAPAAALAEGDMVWCDEALFGKNDKFPDSFWYYEVGDDGCATIVGFKSGSEHLYVPGEVDGHVVTAIGDDAFADKTDLETVVVPEGVKTVGARAFSGCRYLHRVKLPTSLTAIGESAFEGCGDSSNTMNVYYDGTSPGWEEVVKPSSWDESGTIRRLVVHLAEPVPASVEPEGGGNAEAHAISIYSRGLFGVGAYSSYPESGIGATAVAATGWRHLGWRARNGDEEFTKLGKPDETFEPDDEDIVAVFERQEDNDVPGSLPPAPAAATLTFDLAGGTLDGQTGTVTVEATVGDTITLPAAPTREGYTFRCWLGSEYEAGAEYLVEGDHDFTAAWDEAKEAEPTEETDSGDSESKKSSDSGKSSGSSAKQASASKLPSTGDPATTAYALATIGAAALAAGSAARSRRRRG